MRIKAAVVARKPSLGITSIARPLIFRSLMEVSCCTRLFLVRSHEGSYISAIKLECLFSADKMENAQCCLWGLFLSLSKPAGYRQCSLDM